ncbi:MAG: VOC family protein [Acidobacteriia bacterium]|nr:VOC family protein [Terriglobia bacterium]
MAVKPIPDGFHTVTPYLVVQGVPKVMEFLRRAFDAEEVHRSTTPDGTIMHAQMKIGDSMIMMGEATSEHAPQPCSIYLYVKDTDAVYRKALAAGGTSIMEPADMFYGDRNAGVKDASGMQWWIGTHIEDVGPEEMAKRTEAAVKERKRG